MEFIFRKTKFKWSSGWDGLRRTIGNRVNVNSVPEVRILSAPPKRSLRRRCRLFFDKMGRIRTEGGSTEREPSAKRDVSSLLRHIAVNYAALQSLAFSEAFAYAPLLLLFPTRPASLGSRGAPFLAASISYQWHKNRTRFLAGFCFSYADCRAFFHSSIFLILAGWINWQDLLYMI